MAWPSFHFDQTDLSRHCADRVIFPHEYHIQNQLYGMDVLLKQYADLPGDEPLPWAMEHFVSFGNPDPYPADQQSRLPIVLSVSNEQADILRSHDRAQVEAIGSMFFYMRELYQHRYGEDTDDTQRRGTIVFPDKSTTDHDVDYDRKRFARQLSALPSEFQPVYVSVFWKDYLRGSHRPFVQAGLQVVSSGHSYDSEFLFRQHDLCRQFKYACANDLSTSFCMSVLAGCHFFHWPTGPLQVTSGGKTRHYGQEPTLHLPGKQLCIAASPFPPQDNRQEQLALAARFAGVNCLRSPEFFRDLRLESRCRLQERPPASIDFNNVQFFDELSGWLTFGVDADGWAKTDCGFTIPARRDGASVQLYIETWPTTVDHHTRWTVTTNGVAKMIRPETGRWHMKFPSEKKADTAVTIRCPPEMQREFPDRRRAFRLHSIEWLNG